MQGIFQKENTDKALKYGIYRHLPTYEKIIRNLVSFCKKKLFDSYCEWLFDILFEMEKYVDLIHLDEYQKRLYGFLSERLLNVWVKHNKLKAKHLNIINIEMGFWQRIQLIRRRITNQIIFMISKW